MKTYILCIIATAIVCAAVKSLVNKKTASGQIIQLLTGILMTATIMAPLTNISFRNVTDYLKGMRIDANTYVEQGRDASRDGISAIIKSRTEAYILDKAERMGLEITVEVELNDSNNSIPCAVTVSGVISPYARAILSTYIEDTLGISKENHKWT